VNAGATVTPERPEPDSSGRDAVATGRAAAAELLVPGITSA
jgi:hypothetical protein